MFNSKNIRLFIIPFICLCASCMFNLSYASKVLEDSHMVNSEDSDIKIDKFKPSTGQQVKHSQAANFLENLTAKATGKPVEHFDEDDVYGNNVQEEETPVKESNLVRKHNPNVFNWF